MKKFFLNIPLQKEGQLPRLHYTAVGNSNLSMEVPTSFPIITAINGYVKNNEEFQVIAVKQPDNADAERNFGYLNRELEELCEREGISCPEVKIIQGPKTQEVLENVSTFQQLINYTDENDELFADITFGTKPMSMALLMAVRYSRRLKSNARVSCIVYGEADRRGKTDPKDWLAWVYDETALVELDEVTRILADKGVEKPEEVIRSIIEL